MLSYDGSLMSPTKRLGVSLNVDTGYKGTATESSPPGTPIAQPSKGNIPSAGPALRLRNDPRETFLDDITPVNGPMLPSSTVEEANERGAPPRDSHDLSISPRQSTRDSLVDHMLLSLSLDQYSYEEDQRGVQQSNIDDQRLYSSFGDEDSHQQPRTWGPRTGRSVSHGYSYSSDNDHPDDANRPQTTRGRRSNSSSNFQTSLGRINSVRNEAGTNQGFGGSGAGSKGPGQVTPRVLHSRSGKGSKGSSANSLDLGYVQVTNVQRWGHGLAGRSSSFDFGSDRQALNAQSITMTSQATPAGASIMPFDYDAAPTPTVPGGPSRPRPSSPILISRPHPPVLDPAPKKLERKRSTRSSKSAYKGKNDHGLYDPSRELPPMPAFVKEPAPAPLVGYGKSKETTAPPKEKQGFFRRVFGSSRSNSAAAPESPRSHGSTPSAELYGDRPGSRTLQMAGQFRSQHTPPLRESTPIPKEQPTLSKKPSSFFRRRKKSTSETEPPVPVPAIPPVIAAASSKKEPVPAKREPSPVSSLRNVMDPYIRTPQRSPVDVSHPRESMDHQMNNSPELYLRTARGFSPDYEPDISATIRTVQPAARHDTSADHAEIFPSTYSPEPKPFLVAGTSSRDQSSRERSDTTFLQDSSDNDRDANSTSSISVPATAESSETNGINGKKGISPSVARDMALVAEYERTHSKRSPASSKFDTPKPSSAADLSTSSVAARSNSKKTSANSGEKEWVMLTPTKVPTVAEPDSRVWLEPSSSDDAIQIIVPTPCKPGQESLRTSSSTDAANKPATDLPVVKIEGEDEFHDETPQNRSTAASNSIKDLNEQVNEIGTAPANGDREVAQKIYDGNEEHVSKEKAAAWMGEESASRAKILTAYLELYDFTNLNILAALRVICGRLVLKGESQQVDRILDAFAKRWCECNADHGFKVTDIVHTICYSLLLLNTDLHLADIEQKMTRSQFVKNTMPTIRRSVNESAPDAFEPARPTVLPGKTQAFDAVKPTDGSLKPERTSIEAERPSWRNSFKPAPRVDSNGNVPTPLDYDTPSDDCGPLVKAPFHGTLRTWEVQVEIVLKDFYNSIRSERLPLFGAPIEKPQPQQSSNTLSVFTNGVLRRSPSVLSKTPSETQSYARGRTADSMRVGNSKWASKNRSRPRLYPGSGMGSSRTSLDDQSSMWSPSVSSSTWSKYSLGKTHTSMSVNSFDSNYPQGDYQQSIGFANALSQAIIREEHIGSAGSCSDREREELRVAPLLEDESLELAGAPWAKEGMLKHKHHLEALDKKAKDRNWNEVFAVIEKGYMSLFSFSAKSMRKSKGRTARGVVGGGNWQDNAENLGSFLLRQTIASALPPPGYSKARPHVWALSLPTGAVHLFQVGTPDIVKEFVSTANYWSARLSNHPLVGGISNIEYGWSENIVNSALVAVVNEPTRARASSFGHRPSLQSSLRSSLDHSMNGVVKSRLPGDKITISDWTPPTQSMRASNLLEPDQLTTLLAYVDGIEEELQKHNQLRSPMLLAFTPRHPNSQKAMANWEKKSSYLLREIVKFRTYIDCLNAAEAGKQRIYKEREAIKQQNCADDDRDLTLRVE